MPATACCSLIRGLTGPWPGQYNCVQFFFFICYMNLHRYRPTSRSEKICHSHQNQQWHSIVSLCMAAVNYDRDRPSKGGARLFFSGSTPG